MYKNDSMLRIYYTELRDDAFTIESSMQYVEEPTSSIVFMDGYYKKDGQNNPINSHYFRIANVSESSRIGDGAWEQISVDSDVYTMVENIVDKVNGNNPHSGKDRYDNGEEYIDRFRKLFKYPSENRLFKEACFPDTEDAYSDIDSYGFSVSGLTNDVKVHAFMDTYDESGVLSEYDINNKACLSASTPEYADIISETSDADGATSQIINVKNLDLTFYIAGDNTYSRTAQEEIKYIQSKVMPYVEQMIPSTAIVNVRFVPREPY
jgi:hypothetical protein